MPQHSKHDATHNNGDAIANQVFLGMPWKLVRPKYERAVDTLKKSFPLSFIIVGRDESQDAEDLLEVIKRKLMTSSYAIFDATGGNANVSYEYGFAEAMDIPRALYLSDHQHAKKATKESPIISDLAGKKQNRYKQETGLHKLLRHCASDHPYTKRFEAYLKKRSRPFTAGKKKRLRTLALKIIHQLDGDGTARRSDVVQTLLAEATGYKREELDTEIYEMHRAGLIESIQGRYSRLTIR